MAYGQCKQELGQQAMTTTASQSQVDSALRDIESGLESLSCVMAGMRQKLSPVLAPECPAPAEKASTPGAPQSLSPLTCTLRSISGRIERLSATVRDIEVRIDV